MNKWYEQILNSNVEIFFCILGPRRSQTRFKMFPWKSADQTQMALRITFLRLWSEKDKGPHAEPHIQYVL